MPAVRRVTAIATDLTCQTVGRRAVVRAARHVLSQVRLDYHNELHANGEASLRGWMLRCSPPGERLHVADVGANVCLWSRSMLAAAAKANRAADLQLHAFEPDPAAFERLTRTLNGAPADRSRTALSDRAGSAVFHMVGPAAGTNSLYPVPGTNPAAAGQVTTVTLDEYAEQRGINRFVLVKIDAEGHDPAVLLGARGPLAEHRIAVAQFEYNHRWILGRFFLRDAFELVQAFGYRVGKVTPRGVESIPAGIRS